MVEKLHHRGNNRSEKYSCRQNGGKEILEEGGREGVELEFEIELAAAAHFGEVNASPSPASSDSDGDNRAAKVPPASLSTLQSISANLARLILGLVCELS